MPRLCWVCAVAEGAGVQQDDDDVTFARTQARSHTSTQSPGGGAETPDVWPQ